MDFKKLNTDYSNAGLIGLKPRAINHLNPLAEASGN
jgi:hypothetical protein